MQHDIFKTPNALQLTVSDQPTPSSYANYPDGKNLGPTMPMWRVQTEGYTTHPGQLIGIVSRDAGFLDSPDVEWISGGVNSKGPNAVALGRHGNFFHWGFAASPTYMTDEAKDVFANVVHYIARFDRQAPVARKVSGTMMRSSIDGAIESSSDEGHARTVAQYAGYQKDQAQRKAGIQKRIDAGEEVSESERRVLARAPMQVPGRLSRARRIISSDKIQELGEDPTKVASYLREIRPYVRPNGWYSLAVDAELMALQIGNADPKMLDRAITLLGSNDTESVGRLLLERYTAQSFGSAEEWSRWLEGSRSRLFFSESAGYKWLVNTMGDRRKSAPPPQPRATSRAPLDAKLALAPAKGGLFNLTVHVDIFHGWHAYDSTPEGSAYTALGFVLDLPQGVKRVGAWTRPSSHASIEDPDLTIYEGRLVFSCLLSGPVGARPVGCSIRYQVCDEKMCLPPTSTRLEVKLSE